MSITSSCFEAGKKYLLLITMQQSGIESFFFKECLTEGSFTIIDVEEVDESSLRDTGSQVLPLHLIADYEEVL